MRKIFFLICCCLCASLPLTAVAAPALQLQGDTVLLINAGKKTVLPAEEWEVQDVKDRDMRFVGASEEEAKKRGIEPGLYVFDKTGKVAFRLSIEGAESCGEVVFSPKGTMLAVDSGMSSLRTWLFFQYPGLKSMGEVDYYLAEDQPSLFWNGEEGVVFSTLDADAPGRSCDYDPCGPVSVQYHAFKNGKTSTVLAGTTQCDYTLTDFDPTKGEVTAAKLCLTSGKDWENYPENAPTKAVKALLRGK